MKRHARQWTHSIKDTISTHRRKAGGQLPANVNEAHVPDGVHTASMDQAHAPHPMETAWKEDVEFGA